MRQPTGMSGAGAQALIERARRILRQEQRTNHADTVVRPGGIESFLARWVE